ncbi:Uncharacterized membrane protein [Lachnospiraceae bacterium XBB2008]|nr:Uncharacterized membrane protein [Lachnospiraceae bacterium XBB2008]
MNKKDFLDEVRTRLAGLSENDIQNALDFYVEAIDDHIDDGMTEDQAVSAVGTPEEVAEKILMDTPLPTLIKTQAQAMSQKQANTTDQTAQANQTAQTYQSAQTGGMSGNPTPAIPAQAMAQPVKKTKLSPLAIVLIILGAPVWLPLTIALGAVALAIVMAIFALILAVVVAVLGAAIGGVVAIFASLVAIVMGEGVHGLVQLAAALILVGLALLLFIPLKAGFIWLIELAGRFAGWVKFKFVSRRNKI